MAELVLRKKVSTKERQDDLKRLVSVVLRGEPTREQLVSNLLTNPKGFTKAEVDAVIDAMLVSQEIEEVLK